MTMPPRSKEREKHSLSAGPSKSGGEKNLPMKRSTRFLSTLYSCHHRKPESHCGRNTSKMLLPECKTIGLTIALLVCIIGEVASYGLASVLFRVLYFHMMVIPFSACKLYVQCLDPAILLYKISNTFWSYEFVILPFFQETLKQHGRSQINISVCCTESANSLLSGGAKVH